MQTMLDSKNGYMHLFKKEEVKERQEAVERTKQYVSFFTHRKSDYSSFTTKPVATPSQTTAKSASTRANGALIEKNARSQSRCSEPHSPRKINNVKSITLV